MGLGIFLIETVKLLVVIGAAVAGSSQPGYLGNAVGKLQRVKRLSVALFDVLKGLGFSRAACAMEGTGFSP